MMKRMCFLLITITTLVLGQSPERVRAELERTDAVISEVRTVVEPSNNQDASLLLQQAIEIQNNAWNGYHGKRYRWAYSRTLAARNRAREARELVVVGPERVEAEIRRTAELMVDAERTIKRSNDPQVQELWRMAQTEQNQSKDNLRARRFRLALRLTLTARAHVRTALRLIKQLITPEQVAAEIDRTDQLINRIHEPLRASHNIRAEEMFNRAGEWQVRARNAFRENRPGMALRFTLASRDLLLRAWALSTRTITPEMVTSSIEETEKLLKEWEPVIVQSPNSEAQKYLNQAKDNQKSAIELHKNGNLAAAFQQTNRARQLLTRALELLQVDTAPSDAQ